MTATLSGRVCSEVRATLPRYGYWTGWATLTDADAVSEVAGALTLSVAGLSLLCTCVRQGERGGVRTVELVGGYGGWRREAGPAGFRADNLVKISSYADKLALAVGEHIQLASGVDRQLGVVAARLGTIAASDLLSQVCALPVGAAVVPWWVAPDGITRIGPRTGAAIAVDAVDSDDLARRVSFAEDDAAPLLPGATYSGATVEQLELYATPGSVQEVVTLAPSGEEPRTFAALFRRFILSVMGPHVSATRIYRYVVREVAADGRIRAIPVRSVLAPDLSGLRVWPGLAGGRCRPKAGSEILVQFADGDPCASAACVVGFTPAVYGATPLLRLGIPERTELDGDEVVLARGTLPCGRGGTQAVLGPVVPPLAPAALTVAFVDPDGVTHHWTITAAAGVTPVLFSVTPGPGVAASGVATIDEGRAEVLV